MTIKQKREQRKRVPAGMPRQKLTVKGIDPSKKYYWAKESQFSELENAGYSFVSNSPDIEIGEDNYINKSSVISRPASRSTDEKLYLMEINKEWYDENQKIKQDQIEETERQIFNRGDDEHTYAVRGNRRQVETLGAKHG